MSKAVVIAHGTTCPLCGNPARVKRDGTLAGHRGNTRALISDCYEACRAEGRDPATLRAEMTPEQAQTRDRLLRLRELDEEERRDRRR